MSIPSPVELFVGREARVADFASVAPWRRVCRGGPPRGMSLAAAPGPGDSAFRTVAPPRSYNLVGAPVPVLLSRSLYPAVDRRSLDSVESPHRDLHLGRLLVLAVISPAVISAVLRDHRYHLLSSSIDPLSGAPPRATAQPFGCTYVEGLFDSVAVPAPPGA